jgi:hypothetical protein
VDLSLYTGVGGVPGAAIGSDALTLQKGTRLEPELERPLLFELRR